MNRKRFVRWLSAFVLLFALVCFYWSEIAGGYRAAYPRDPLRAHALAECAHMNPQFNRFWAADRTMCYEGHRIAQ